jgi:hypothetical protein
MAIGFQYKINVDQYDKYLREGGVSWRSVLLVEKITDLSQVTDKLLSHDIVSSTPRLSVIRTHYVGGDRH